MYGYDLISFHFISFISTQSIKNNVEHKFKICKVIIKWRNHEKHTWGLLKVIPFKDI